MLLREASEPSSVRNQMHINLNYQDYFKIYGHPHINRYLLNIIIIVFIREVQELMVIGEFSSVG